MEKLQPHKTGIRVFYFLIGVIATVAYRIIIILSDGNVFWLKLFWYVGTIGFIIYFAHRYSISEKRSKIINDLNLDEKIKKVDNLNEEEKYAMEYIFDSLKVSSEKWIYIIIFVSSALALAAGIYLDFLRY